MVKISEAELEVMQVIWERKNATSFDIIEELKNKKWSDNTVRTLIKRLYKKGAIDIVKKEGKTFTYSAKIKESEYQKKESKHFLDTIFRGSIDDLLLNFVKQEELSKKDLEKLLQKIDKEVK
ncbi:MAG: BlaI/MecI/CopY family transcriptional regulator [Candidatus Scatovivens sp.]